MVAAKEYVDAVCWPSRQGGALSAVGCKTQQVTVYTYIIRENVFFLSFFPDMLDRGKYSDGDPTRLVRFENLLVSSWSGPLRSVRFRTHLLPRPDSTREGACYTVGGVPLFVF